MRKHWLARGSYYKSSFRVRIIWNLNVAEQRMNKKSQHVHYKNKIKEKFQQHKDTSILYISNRFTKKNL